jgi:predicted tellurium resistance membrane protein TerC
MGWLTQPEIWIAFVTLAALEIVLGIDNIVFISVLVSRLPEHRRALAYRLGLGLAMIMRILLLLALSWVIGLTRPLVSVLSHTVSGRDLVLFAGGLFLVANSTREIHAKIEARESSKVVARTASLSGVLIQIMLLDVIFSLDSVITAVGMARQIGVMVAAVICAVLIMMVFAKAVGDFVERHATIKMLALAFLLLIGVMLLAEGAGHHLPKGYIYFAMAFSLFVEMLNMRAGSRGRRGQPHPQPSGEGI